ncbi:FHA domain-containing protein [Methylocaldum marinum]|uniref:FHA domain-containing protein n=1 Tax=Methylocaldum marinum TaxID=1432792 RepID=A0A250KMV1_9GAMM|nr:FHA domain-containing protein [Methylocaldum marinum]BBA32918.1 FHA domain-containing protein [Methylocaldum marinum]
MAKLTLTFKGQSLQTITLKPGEIRIGRDPSNALHIDSLAVAPVHAIIESTGEQTIIREVDVEFPVFVNGKKVVEHALGHGDKITIGKHVVFYNKDDIFGSERLEDLEQEPEVWTETDAKYFNGSLQVLSGRQIGLVIPLKKSLVRLGKEGSGVVVIAKRKNGYFISPLAEGTSLSVNDQPVKDEAVLLNDGDLIKVNESLMQFFQE